MERRRLDVVVLSDVHLGTYGCRAKELLNYLRSIQPDMLILNGDIIDGWQFSKRFFPSLHMQVINELMQLITLGTRIVYITGNHDEMLRRYTDLQMGNFTLTDKLVLEIDGKMTWIFHGDVFDNTTRGSARLMAKLGSNGYGLLILFNRFVNALLGFFGREKVSISKKIMEGVNQAVAKVNDLEQIASSLAIKKDYDYVICGHIHRPAHKTIENAEGTVVYLNAGDWVEHMTALEYENKSWRLFYYNDKDFPASSQAEARQTLSVITDLVTVHFSKA
ncbi:MAG TPA: UDP-2,3-diacylglucosamine hydrolase [Chitinophagaceae bacterium]|jgi:UDP-2,3-diacylglucosamine pyrophosphatase LpxH|nr:UDP-2,3-diacylglucosamine hydrolase [Chitinophagaceae bacterium]